MQIVSALSLLRDLRNAMTKIIDIQLPKNELGNDPHDFRHHPEFIPDKPASVLEKMDSWILTPEQEARAKAGFWLFNPSFITITLV